MCISNLQQIILIIFSVIRKLHHESQTLHRHGSFMVAGNSNNIIRSSRLLLDHCRRMESSARCFGVSHLCIQEESVEGSCEFIW